MSELLEGYMQMRIQAFWLRTTFFFIIVIISFRSLFNVFNQNQRESHCTMTSCNSSDLLKFKGRVTEKENLNCENSKHFCFRVYLKLKENILSKKVKH